MRACIEVPHHITAFFKPYITSDVKRTGSIGAGIAVEPSGRVCVGKPGISGKGLHEGPPHFHRVLERLEVMLESPYRIIYPLPPGRGYAVSAVSSLMGAYVSSLISGIPLSRAVLEAHRIDVEMRTGLGDVAAIAGCGLGIVYREVPGPPPYGMVDCIPVDPSLSIIVGEAGAMNTSDLLSLYESYNVWEEASKALHRFLKNPGFDRFVETATSYTRQLRLDEKLIGVNLQVLLRQFDIAGYFVKKKLAVVIAGSTSVEEISTSLEENGMKVRLLRPSTRPPGFSW